MNNEKNLKHNSLKPNHSTYVVNFVICGNFVGEDSIKIPGVNPTFWLNHIFFTNPMQFDASVSLKSIAIFKLHIYSQCM